MTPKEWKFSRILTADFCPASQSLFAKMARYLSLIGAVLLLSADAHARGGPRGGLEEFLVILFLVGAGLLGFLYWVTRVVNWIDKRFFEKMRHERMRKRLDAASADFYHNLLVERFGDPADQPQPSDSCHNGSKKEQ